MTFRIGVNLVFLMSKNMPLQTIASLKIGESGTISEESMDKIPLKLLEMGCLPGAEVTVNQFAPLKDPIYICVNGSHLAIRVETAKQIRIIKNEK